MCLQVFKCPSCQGVGYLRRVANNRASAKKNHEQLLHCKDCDYIGRVSQPNVVAKSDNNFVIAKELICQNQTKGMFGDSTSEMLINLRPFHMQFRICTHIYYTKLFSMVTLEQGFNRM